MGQVLTSVHFSSKKNDWETPDDLFARLDSEFEFRLDACASESNTKCAQFISVCRDALMTPWPAFPAFMNPPYGRQIGKFVARAYDQSRFGTVVCLLPARTDTRWWHDYCMKGEIRFIRGRLRFKGAKSSAPFPSAIVIFRNLSRTNPQTFSTSTPARE